MALRSKAPDSQGESAPAGNGGGPAFPLKRLLLGQPIATARLEHERLGKPTALAVFSSDNMSSVAYATEEILRVLLPAAGIAAFSLVLPISAVVVLVEVILIFSYRQTIKAYPTAGGAYIVTKDNIGLLPAQVAGVALLTDYVLTVAVSVAAGVQAITSVAPSLYPYRIELSLVFIWLIAYGNLLGVRESGRLFAVPTYVFIISLYLTVAAGLYEVLSGHVHAQPVHAQPGALTLGTAAITVFLVLKAFASGGAAVTGVEAISNGVPAFRKPEWRNAQDTLIYMGLVLCISFLGVSYLAHRLRIVPVADESKSVLYQIGHLVYAKVPLGGSLLFLLQISTTLILILAANTSFADFPRLASFHAGDAFLPRQFTKRGHKLVFSNGIIALAAAASVLVVMFKASVTNLIPLYALGVFTSFTLSQTGMARRHLRLREPGWRRGLLINGAGAVMTAVVDMIIAVVKFKGGAWIVMVFVPVLVLLLVRVNRTYEAEEEDLLSGLDAFDGSQARSHTAIVIIDALDDRSWNAIRYALTIRPESIRVAFVSTDHATSARLERSWALAGPRLPLDPILCEGRPRSECLREYLVRHAAPGTDVTVIFSAPSRIPTLQRVLHGRSWSDVAEMVQGLPNVSLVAVRQTGERFGTKGGRFTVTPAARHKVVILVGRLDRSVLKAIRYARRVDAIDVTALHVGVDPDHATQLLEDWWEVGRTLATPLVVEESPDRDIPRVVEEFVRDFRGSNSHVTVVLPRHDYAGLFQRLLHDRTSRAISDALRDEDRVDVVVVPYRLLPRDERVAQRDVVGRARA